MNLRQLQGRPAQWDSKIEKFATKTLFHESVWLDYVLSINPKAQIEYFEICEQSRVIGYYCAIRVSKALLPVYGCPLPGSALYLGPIVNLEISQSELIHLLLDTMRHNHIGHFEVAHDWLNPEVMRQCGFQEIATSNHLCPLAATEEQAWKSLRSTGRNRIRKAQSNGLVAEIADDPSIVEYFYTQLCDVMRRKGTPPPYGIERPRLLYQHLLPADRLFPVWVKHGKRVIAAGLFPHDSRCVYYWDAAWSIADSKLYPNELLHWSVIRLAIARRIPLYNMYGGSNVFKRKFGGTDTPYRRYRIALLPLVTTAAVVRDYLDVRTNDAKKSWREFVTSGNKVPPTEFE